MNIVIYFLFNGGVTLIGRGSAVLIKKIMKNKINLDTIKILNLNLLFIYPLLGLFIIGNISLIGNFLIPIDSIIFKILFLFLIFMNTFEKINVKNTKLFITNTICIPLLLFLSIYSINFAQDAGLYQLNSQFWIKSSRTVIGISNLHSRYGYSSISEFIGANFWMENNFILLHFVSLIFITFFFTFLINNIFLYENNFLKYTSLSIILMGILDNFGFGGGRNGFIDIDAVMKQDTAFAVLFFFGSIFIINQVINEEFNPLNILYASLIILFSIQLRIFGFVMLFIFLYYLVQSFLNGVKLVNIFMYLSPAIFLFTIWTIKNIMTSGCMIYPVEVSCIDSLSWYEYGLASLESNDLNTFHMAYNLGDDISLWFKNWSMKDTNINPIKNFSLTFMFLILFKRVYFKKVARKRYKKKKVASSSYIIFCFLIWMLSAPSTRFAIGLFLITVCLIFIDIENYKNRFVIPNILYKTSVALIIFISIFTLNRLESYQNFFSDPFRNIELASNEIKYVSNLSGWGVTPINGSSCWINLYCLPKEKNIQQKEIYGYTIFLLR